MEHDGDISVDLVTGTTKEKETNKNFEVDPVGSADVIFSGNVPQSTVDASAVDSITDEKRDEFFKFSRELKIEKIPTTGLDDGSMYETVRNDAAEGQVPGEVVEEELSVGTSSSEKMNCSSVNAKTEHDPLAVNAVSNPKKVQEEVVRNGASSNTFFLYRRPSFSSVSDLLKLVE